MENGTLAARNKQKQGFNLVSLIKLLSFLSLTILGYFFYKYDLHLYFQLSYIQDQRSEFEQLFFQRPFSTAGVFCLVYIVITTFSFPGAAVLTLLAGALFPFPVALAMVSFSSVTGATFALIITRFLYQKIISQRFKKAYEIINSGFKREGNMYLFALRLVPLFPFFIVNYIFAITTIPIWSFIWVSALGMLPGTVLYINAGYQLSVIESLDEIISFPLLASFAAIALLPFVFKFAISSYRRRVLYKKHNKPKKFNYNIVVIGAGSAGLVSSYIAAKAGAKVLLVEKEKMGGDCLNYGCVPSKTLLKIASEAHAVKKIANTSYIKTTAAKINFPAVMKEVQKTIQKIAPHDSRERYTKLGVECIDGQAEIISPFLVKIGEKVVSTKSIVIATGAQPAIPDFLSSTAKEIKANFLTSDSLWGLKKLPSKLLIIGGGAIGVEMAQAFSRLGSKVTIVEFKDRLLSGENPDVSKLISQQLVSEGVNVLCGTKLNGFKQKNTAKKECVAIVEKADKTKKNIVFDKVLFAVGRRANTEKLGLAQLDIETRKNGSIVVNDFLQTTFPNIFACGDVCGPFQLTHAAAHQAWYAVMNALYGHFKLFKVDYRSMSWCIYTSPEIATTGLTMAEAEKEEIAYELTHFPLDELDRAIIENDTGFVQVLTVPGKDEILGATIVSKAASTMITEFVAAIKNKKGLKSILSTIHAYPSLTEANKYAAGVWQREHLPVKLIEFSKKYLSKTRGD